MCHLDAIRVRWGACVDTDGNIYPQFAVSTPDLTPSVTVGRASNVREYLTGPSIALGGQRVNIGWSPSGRGYGVDPAALLQGRSANIGAPVLSATMGFGPYNIRDLPTLLRPPAGTFEPTYPLP